MSNQLVIFGLVGGGALLLTASITGSTLSQTVQGHPNKVSDTSSIGSVFGGGNGLVGGVGTAAAAAVSTANGLSGTAGDTHSATWAKDLLKALGAPATAANVTSLVDWIDREGNLPNIDQYNPLDTTESGYGGTSTNSAGVKTYPSWAQGINATVATLEGGYPAITAALKAGTGLNSNDPAIASELSTWSGGGYSGIPGGG